MQISRRTTVQVADREELVDAVLGASRALMAVATRFAHATGDVPEQNW